MKLRIRDNSIRFRLTRSEVAQLQESYIVEARTCFTFGVNQTLFYQLEASIEESEIKASFQNNTISVRIPRAEAIAWAKSETIALLAEQADSKLKILIEKDFACLKPRQNEVEDESDMYPHPNAASGHC